MCTLTDVDPDVLAALGDAPATDASVTGTWHHPQACRALHEADEVPLGELCNDGELCGDWDEPRPWELPDDH